MAADPQQEEIIMVPLAGTRAQSVYRLQVGLAGLGAMVLLVGLATVILDRVKQSDAGTVPEAAASVAAAQSTAANDPLADAGVAPEMPVAPKPKPSPPVMVDPNAIPASTKQ